MTNLIRIPIGVAERIYQNNPRKIRVGFDPCTYEGKVKWQNLEIGDFAVNIAPPNAPWEFLVRPDSPMIPKN